MITRKDLEKQLARLNTALALHGHEGYELSYARLYGGYELTRRGEGGWQATHRMSGKEMAQYMAGMDMGLLFAR